MIRVKGGVFSLTPPAEPDDDGSYLAWHLLDHMPEQYQLPGLAPILEKRWASGVGRPLFAGPLKSMVKWDAWPE